MGERRKETLPKLAGSEPKAIAIIGMSCRLPAGATNIENLWTALASGQSGWSPHPSERYMPERYYHPNPDKKGTYYSKGGHYLDEDIAVFDAQFFNITAAEATTMDPQQRHLLEVSYEALENAGLRLPDIAGTNMGVFIGGSNSEYRAHIQCDIDNLPMFEATGNAESLLANRVSYVYDLRGPSLTIDTACSSSLAALNSAFLSLQAGESSTAIVAGSVVRIMPASTISLSAMRLLSPDGRCYAFDDRGISGFGRGEGSACIILKPLEAALKDGDPVRSVIRNSGVNQDGKTTGITMPNGEAQASLIRSVYRATGLNPLQTDYVEAHGTGTATGDPIEAAALGKVFGRGPDQSPVVVGSIKSNIGHLEAVSGVASVIKAALMLERRFYAPNCDLQTLNPKIPFQEMNLKVSHKFRPWDCTGVRRASVNNFGFGGTNAHIVMEEALSKRDIRAMPGDARASLLNSSTSSTAAMEPVTKPYLFLLSANDRESLLKSIALVAEYLNERPGPLFPDLLRSLAFTLGQRRTLLPWKVAMQAVDHDNLIQKLKDIALTPTRSVEQPRIGFVFTGQGSQWPKMGSQLYHAYPTYASAIQQADHVLKGLGASWSLIAELEKSEEYSLVDSPSISQPACTALQIALVDLLYSWGITAHSVTGHSSGEIAAAYGAGILGMESCMAIAYYRGLVATSLIEKPDGTSGGMLAVGASQRDTQALIDARTDTVGDCTIACINSPNSMTVSGDTARISQISALADTKLIWNRRLKVEVAYHSHHMNAVADQYNSLLGEVKPNRDARAKFHSSLRGHEVDPSTLDASYWVGNLTFPVRFSEAFTSLCEPKGDSKRGVDLVIEIGPHSTLQGPIRQITQTFEGSPRQIQSFSSVVRNTDSTASLLDLSAQLVTNGCKLQLAKVNFPSSAPTPNVLIDLPLYQWNHTKRYWYEVRERQEMMKYMFPRHDLLGSREPDCTIEAPRWKNVLTVEDVPWLRDHSVQDVIIFPMAGYLCMAMEACRQQAQCKGRTFDRVTLQHVTVHRPLTLSDTAAIELHLSLTPWNEGSYSLSDTWSHFKVSSWASERGWLDHCRGIVAATLPDQQNPVCRRDESRAGLEHQMGDLSKLRDLCKEPRDADDLYRICEEAGFHFGPTFRQVQEVQMGPSHQATYTVTIPDTLTCMPYNRQSDYVIHPISLDVVFQGATLFLAEDDNTTEGPYMPVSIREITVAVGMVEDPGSIFRVHAKSTAPDAFSRRRSFDYVAIDMQRASHPSGIVAKGVVEAPVQGGEISQEGSEMRCLRTQWEPNMSYLNQDNSEAMLSLPPPGLSDPQALRKLEEMGLDYIKQALRQTNFDEIPTTYVRKLYAWMESKMYEANGDVTKNKAHEPNGDVTKGQMPVESTDGVPHGIRQDLNGASANGEVHGKANGGNPSNKADESNGDAVNSKVGIEPVDGASKGLVHNGQLLNSHTPNGDFPIHKAHIEPNGDLTNDHELRIQAPNVNTRQGSIGNHDNTSSSHAESTRLAMLLMRRVGAQLPAILQGRIDPAVLMSEDNLLSRFNAEFQGMSRLYSAAATYIQKLAFQSPVLRILEIGGNDTLATSQILEGLSTASESSFRSVQYEIVGESADMTVKLAPWTHIFKQIKFDQTKSLSSLNLDKGSYDVIVVTDNDLSRNQKNLADIHLLLKTGGKLILFQNPRDRDHASLLPLATHPGWWVEDGIDCDRGTNSYSEEVQSRSVLEACGFSGPQITVHADSKENHRGPSVVFMNASATTTPLDRNRNLVIVAQWLPHGVSRSQIEAAIQDGDPAGVEWVEFARLADIDLEGRYCVVVDNPHEHYLTRLTTGSFEGMKRLTQAAGVLWITGGLLSSNAGLVRGLARTLRAEFQMDKFVTLAIEDWSMPVDELVEVIGRVIEQSFFKECTTAEYDRELAVKDCILQIPRLVHDNVMNQNLSRETHAESKYLQPFKQEGRPLRLTITSPGFLDTLSFVNDERPASPLPEDEIEIEVKASGLNFKDVILALGQLPGYYLGQECSGIVTKAGFGASKLKIGDRVCAIAAGSIANVARCKVACTVKLPESISFADGASIPLIYCTAQYCLAHVARLKPGETILIHAAAGGVGQSAMMLAQASKAKVFATVGSQDKKIFLMQTYGIPEDQIFYSRDTSFVQGVLKATNGKGVDVVLNSLAGEQLRATWRCMAPFGRFVEIGKRDITTNMYLEMAPFESTVTFAGVDLGDLIQLRPEKLQEVFVEVMDLMRSGSIKPVSPVHDFAISDTETAFRSLQSGKLTGKVVITPRSGDMVTTSRPTIEPAILREDVSYLITGGTGGIGRAICSWMGKHGAKNIILASRSGRKQANTMEIVEELLSLGVKVQVCQSDVAIAEDLQRLISDCARSMPPIGGVIHGAYVNKDVAFELATYQDWVDVVQPKYQGAWNMHNALLDHKLDFFIMLSSISAVIGNRGQAAYAAANSFLDDFAHYRASQGLPGTSINLGVVKEIGHVAERPELQKRLESLSGDVALSKADVLALVKLAIVGKIDQHADHQCTAGLSFDNYSSESPAFYWATDARFCHLRRGMGVLEDKESGTSISTRQALKKAQTKEKAAEITTSALIGKFSSVLITPVEEVSTNKPIVALGLDSLVAVEVRSWIAKEMDAKMSTMELMTSSSIKALAEVIVGRSNLLEELRSKGEE